MVLLSVGAGIEQIEVIKKAREKGHYIIAIDNRKEAEGFSYANEFKQMDLVDEVRVIKFAKEKNVEGVLQSPIGKLLYIVGRLNDELGLIGVNTIAAKNCVNKEITNKILKENQVFCANQIVVNNEQDIADIKENIKYPVVCKPSDGSGSKDVEVIFSEVELNRYLKQKSKIEKIIIEEYLYGKEYGIDFIIINNIGKLILVREKELTDLPFRQETAIYTIKYDEILYKNIEKTIKLACRALGIDNSLVHADIKIDGCKVKIIEISARPSGLMISSKLVNLACNIDFLDLGIDIITKRQKNISPYHSNLNYAICFFDLQEGIVKKINDFYKLENLIEYNLNIKEGEKICKVKNGSDLINRGYFLLKGDSVEEIKKVKMEILKKIVISKNN